VGLWYHLAMRPLCLALVFACSSYNDAAPKAEADAGTAVDGGMDTSAPPAPTLYVSQANGNDGNEGLSTASPLKTLRGALGKIEALNLVGYEVRLCQGTYEETDARVTRALTVRGAYNCGTWTRSGSFGKKGGFRDPNATRITRSKASSETATLTVDTKDTVSIEGIEVQGGESLPLSKALFAQNGALTLRDSLLIGTPSMAAGRTIGLDTLNESLDVADCEIRGGAAVVAAPDDDYASQGALLRASSGTVRSTTISAGTGQGAAAAVGIYIQGSAASPLRIENNEVFGAASRGTPRGSDNSAPFVGIYASRTKGLIVAANTVRGGTALSEDAGNRTTVLMGVFINGESTVLEANRVDPGNVTGGANNYCYGMYVAGTASVYNNAVSSGCEQTNAIASQRNVGIVSYGKLHIAHNTVLAQRSKTVSRGSYAIDVTYSNATAFADLVVENNILVADDGVAFDIQQCGGVKIGTPTHNVLIAPFAARLIAGSCAAPTVSYLADLTLFKSPNNVILESPVGKFSPGTLAEWTTSMRTGTVRPKACDLARLGSPLNPAIPKDIAGVARTARPSPGAWEVDLAACP
jgi:hypothetical protein